MVQSISCICILILARLWNLLTFVQHIDQHGRSVHAWPIRMLLCTWFYFSYSVAQRNCVFRFFCWTSCVLQFLTSPWRKYTVIIHHHDLFLIFSFNANCPVIVTSYLSTWNWKGFTAWKNCHQWQLCGPRASARCGSSISSITWVKIWFRTKLTCRKFWID